MARPKVLVLATPYLYASLVAHLLTTRAGYDVVVPDLDRGDLPPLTRFDAVVATFPAPSVDAAVAVRLPDSFEEPVAVTIGELTVSVQVDVDHPLEDVIAVLEQSLRRAQPATAQP